MVTKVRICIIGNGLFAHKVHCPSLCSFEDVEIVGICAFNELRLKQNAGDFNIPGKIFVQQNNAIIIKSKLNYHLLIINYRLT